MEGYIDVIRSHQMGFKNAVATCGTALTDEQARALKRTCARVVFAYDGDEAGQKAMLRGTEVLLSSGFESIQIMILPDNHDPDTFLQEFGAEAFAQKLNEACGFFDFFLARARRDNDQRTPEGKASIAEMLIPLLKKVGKSIAQNAYVRNLAEAIGVQETLILRQLSSSQSPGREINIADSLADQHDSAQSAAERKMLFLLLECEPARKVAVSKISPEWLRDSMVRKWFKRIGDTDEEMVGWSSVIKTAEGDDESFLRGLALMEESCADPVTTINQLAARFHRHFLIEQTRMREKRMEELHLNGELDDVQNLCRECDESSNSVKTLTPNYFLKPANRRSAH
jgi:DNA primase